MFVLIFGILVILYEYGYFWVVCCCGVKVFCFLVGFGKFLFFWYDCYGMEFVVVVIFFGGYVKMLDEWEGLVLVEFKD